ncbi:MAG: GNAT family protein [Coxiellaceae bacterium]|nr:GNAT family protein [Coxiellaceae bacterium]
MLREVTLDDATLLYDWQSDPATRQYFFNTEAPSWASHHQWLKASLLSEQRILLLAYNTNPLGVLRYDFAKNGQAETSIYVDPEQHGRGYGSAILLAGKAWVRQKKHAINQLTAQIKPNNIASIKVFEKAGYRKDNQLYVVDL